MTRGPRLLVPTALLVATLGVSTLAVQAVGALEGTSGRAVQADGPDAPAWVTVEAADIDEQPVAPEGLTPQGTINPDQGDLIWYTGTERVVPGQLGTAVLAAHMIYYDEPDVFADLDGFHSAQHVHARLRAAGDSVGLSTVYRAVQSLADDGELDSIRTDSGEALYRRCSPQHHHHLVCRGCGLTVEVEGPAVEQWADRVAGEHGFDDVSHTLEIFGTCTRCRAAADDPAADPATVSAEPSG